MSHVDDGTLHAYLDGELSPAEAHGVDAHLAQCPLCRTRLEDERALIARADELLGLAAPPDQEAPPPPFRPGDLTPPVRLWWRVRLPLAWAATVALALGIGTYLGGRAARSLPQATKPAADTELPQLTAPRLAARAPAVARTAPAPPAPPAQQRVVREPEALRGVLDAAASAPGRKDAALTLDSARALLGTEPLAVPGLPVRAIRHARMIGYSALVIVEQALDSSTTIEVINGRASPMALETVVVPAADQADSSNAVKGAPASRAVAHQADSLATAARKAYAELLLEVRGPLTPDSLAALRRRLEPLRP